MLMREVGSARCFLLIDVDLVRGFNDAHLGANAVAAANLDFLLYDIFGCLINIISDLLGQVFGLWGRTSLDSQDLLALLQARIQNVNTLGVDLHWLEPIWVLVLRVDGGETVQKDLHLLWGQIPN